MTAALVMPPLANTQDTDSAAFGNTADTLAAIYQSEVTLAVWQRKNTPDLIAECQNLLHKKGFMGIRHTYPNSKIATLKKHIPELTDYPLLSADIQLLAEMFSCLFDINGVGIRLTALDNAMCPKFHVDRVPCRLITTYVGVGTDWIPHHTVDRSKLGAGSKGLSDAESGLYSGPHTIQVITTGDIALLKGEAWEGNEGAGLVHRSPPIANGQKRLLLTLDFL
ncbi:DUF1826 domain-containing protein [Zhongshania sp.]|jgi:hypothetical protein|uniref:DUF1826 domain-containing protein n=1 Tax=Zhongshania sp. TaxID=1971902 RepID=UPI0039E239B8